MYKQCFVTEQLLVFYKEKRESVIKHYIIKHYIITLLVKFLNKSSLYISLKNEELLKNLLKRVLNVTFSCYIVILFSMIL